MGNFVNLDELDDEPQVEVKNKIAPQKELKVEANEEQSDEKEVIDALREMAQGVPSESKVEHEKYKYAKRKQFNFNLVPEPIIDEFKKMAKKKKMTQKEFLYDCLRKAGLNIPEYDKIDGRRR
ncbi:hypothetical protein [Marinicella sp. W31]|uniref:hypothetical protein n=1 Tax=Marinicella sp. W31 TaxID=3023713 RepID=UPI0037581A81